MKFYYFKLFDKDDNQYFLTNYLIRHGNISGLILHPVTCNV